MSWRADPRAAALADRHYNRQRPGHPQFVPPGRCLVLITDPATAVWVTSWPIGAYVQHRWPDAWVNSLFRREAGPQASEPAGTTAAGLLAFRLPPEAMPEPAAPGHSQLAIGEAS